MAEHLSTEIMVASRILANTTMFWKLEQGTGFRPTKCVQPRWNYTSFYKYSSMWLPKVFQHICLQM